MTTSTVAIIGAGRVGSSVGFLLKRAGYAISAVAARSRASAEQAAAFIGAGTPTTDVVQAASQAGVIFITTPDRIIPQVCGIISGSGALKPGALVIHMSGAHSLDLLSSARAAGALRAVLHPLQSLASREQGIKTLPGSYFRIEADPEATAIAGELVAALGGTALSMPRWSSGLASAALYHAGAVAASNYFVALVDYSLKFYVALGADKREALKAILPLIKGTLQNIETLGIPDALTGPIMRGDAETVRNHLDAMQERTPELLVLYKALARQTITVAREKGSLTVETAEQLLTLVKS